MVRRSMLVVWIVKYGGALRVDQPVCTKSRASTALTSSSEHPRQGEEPMHPMVGPAPGQPRPGEHAADRAPADLGLEPARPARRRAENVGCVEQLQLEGDQQRRRQRYAAHPGVPARSKLVENRRAAPMLPALSGADVDRGSPVGSTSGGRRGEEAIPPQSSLQTHW